MIKNLEDKFLKVFHGEKVFFRRESERQKNRHYFFKIKVYFRSKSFHFVDIC